MATKADFGNALAVAFNADLVDTLLARLIEELEGERTDRAKLVLTRDPTEGHFLVMVLKGYLLPSPRLSRAGGGCLRALLR